jgi:aminobenzoyl-glutamate utilization protein A
VDDSVDVREVRRDVHRHPEVGFTEFRTASRAAGLLADLGWTITTGADAMAADARRGMPAADELAAAYQRAQEHEADARYLPAMRDGMTAVVGELRGARPGPVLGIRADMDALPLPESKDTSHLPARAGFGSRWAGTMHACGHDGHVAIALGLAARLAGDRDFPGTVKLFLQPAEEGARGARAMVAAGVADDVDAFVAPHLGLGLPTGSIAPAVPELLANTKLRATFHGRAAHASSSPHEGRHAILGAAAAALGVHALPPYPGHLTRVNVGQLVGGTSSNIVPDSAVLLLETRADDEAVAAELDTRACFRS